MAEKESKPPSTSNSSAGAPPRPTLSLPPRPFNEAFFNGGVGFSPGPLTLVSNLFSNSDEHKSFSQLLAGAMASPAAAASQQIPGSSGVGDGGGWNVSGDVDPRFKQNRPTGLMITQPPGMFTVPPGLSPATLLDSPSFLGLFSPAQGGFGISHQQALAQVTAQAVQANSHIQSQPEEPYSSAPSTSISESLLSQRESSDISIHEQRSQPLNVNKPADDGYNWRKYGQKQVKGSEFPRSYYKCTHHGCPVKKKVERSLDGQVTEIIYKGQHDHEPPQNKRANRDSSMMSDVASRYQTSNNFNKSKRDYDQTSQATTTEQMSETSDSEEVGNEENVIEKKDEDAHDAKRRCTEEVRVLEPAASHKTVTEPRIIVQTTSEVDLLDDGYRWRKYGQKIVKGNPYPRSYYKCTTTGCNVRKHVERAATDPKAVITTYEGKHNHDLPAARTSSHAATQAQSRSHHLHAPAAGLSQHQPQPIARLRLKEEKIT